MDNACEIVQNAADPVSEKPEESTNGVRGLKLIDDNAAKGDSADIKLQNHDSEFAIKIISLERDLKNTASERDDYRKKFNEVEKRLKELQASYDAITSEDGNDVSLRKEVEELKKNLSRTQSQLDDKVRVMVNQENQINALNNQVSSLKEVVQITKDLLNIRNMEVKHLQHDVDSMESKISNEKERHNAMITKMDAAVRLNDDLKREYQTQLRLFQDLRSQYDKKVTLLAEENQALASANASVNSA